MNADAPNQSDPRALLEQRLAGLYQVLAEMENLDQQAATINSKHSFRGRSHTAPLSLWAALGLGFAAAVAGVITVDYPPFGTALSFLLALAPVVGSIILIIKRLPWTIPLIVSTIGASGVTAGILLHIPFLYLFSAFTCGIALVLIWNAFLPQINAARDCENHSLFQRAKTESAPEFAALNEQLRLVQATYNQHYRGWFPERFLSAQAVRDCWQIVHDHRAETLQDTINLYISDLHSQAMRQTVNAQLAVAQQQAVEQQRATQVAKIGNVINAAGFGAVITNQMRQQKPRRR